MDMPQREWLTTKNPSDSESVNLTFTINTHYPVGKKE